MYKLFYTLISIDLIIFNYCLIVCLIQCYMDVDTTTTKSIKMLVEREMASFSSSSLSYNNKNKKIPNPATEPNMLSNATQKSSFGVSFRKLRKKLGHGDVGSNNRRHRRWLFGGKTQVDKTESKRHLLDVLDNHSGVVEDGRQVQCPSDKIIFTSTSDYFLSKSPIYGPGRYKDPGLSPRRLPFLPMCDCDRAGHGIKGNKQQEFDGGVENSSPGLSPRRSECSPPPWISTDEEDKTTSMVVDRDSHYIEILQVVEDNITIGKTNGPSPVSVLGHPFSSDDISSHESTEDTDKALSYVITENSYGDEDSGFPASTRLIDFDDYLEFDWKNYRTTACMNDEEFKHGYVIALLEASCLRNQETWELRSPYSDYQFLDPVFYNEIKKNPLGKSKNPVDLKLLFDCINEVLIKIHRKYFLRPIPISLSPPFSSIKHPVFPSPEKQVGELLEKINCHLNPSKMPLLATLLDDIVAKDLGNTTTSWFDMVSGIDDIGKEFGDQILEDILEETTVFLSLHHAS